MSLAAGTRLGHYEILAPLGAGGMGEVYRASDTKLLRDVAVKIVRTGGVDDPGARGRFRGEALALSRLNHPNVATIFDFGTHDDMDYLVMEFIPGRSLAELLREGPIARAELMPLALQLAEGLSAAHDGGLVHRDLKPANVRVTPAGLLKILDFGLARPLEGTSRSESAVTVTVAGQAVGTMAYMAPEVLGGARADTRSDVFALGLVLYEMTTGRHPFPADSPIALLNAIANRTPASPRALRSDLPEGLDVVILDAMHHDPARRPADARAVLVALQRVGSGEVAMRPARPAGRTARARVRSLVVLPLDNLSGDPSQDFFADGMTEALIADIAKIDGLRVISRTSAMRYKGARRPLPEIAAELGVDAVVEGSVMRSGERVRVTAQLIHASSDAHLWADSFDRDLSDVLSLQSEVARAIAAEIRIKLTPRARARLAVSRRVNPAAHEAYLRGRHLLNQRTEESLLKAAEHFRQAIELDPTYAVAQVGLGDVHNLFGYYHYRSPADSFPLARAAAERALEADPGLGEAHVSRAYALLYHDWEARAAEREFRRGIELNPAYPQGPLWYLNLLTAEERFDEALERAARVRELDPVSGFALNVTPWVHYFRHDYERAIDGFEKAAEIEPRFGPGRLWHSWPLIQRGRHELALRQLDAARELFGDPLVVRLSRAYTHAVAGQAADARALLDAALAPEQRRYVPPHLVAITLDALGDRTGAWEWLERAVAERSHWLVFIDVDPIYDPFRSDPRFPVLRERAGLRPRRAP